MTTRILIYATLFWLALTALLSNAAAQAGSVNEAPRATPVPTPIVSLVMSPAEHSNGQSKVRIDPGADQYKLLFPTGYEGKRSYNPRTEASEEERAIYSQRVNFIEQLNEAGEQGYRLVTSVNSYPIAVVRLDQGQYEYAWFETISETILQQPETTCLPHFGRDFEKSYAELSRQGFRVVDRVASGQSVRTAFPARRENICQTRTLFLLERKKGEGKSIQHVLIFWGANQTLAVSTEVNEQLTKGFCPSRAFSRDEILLEQTGVKDGILGDKPEIQLVSSSRTWGNDNLDKKVNELAKQGYRLALANREAALMYRRSEMVTSVSYIWLEAKRKDFEKQLVKVQESGAIYRMAYPDRQGGKNKLIFERSLVDDGQRREYKVLKFEFQETENAAAKRVYIDLTAASKETLKLLNSLAKEGFVVRDLFNSDKVSVLLERSR